MKAQAIFDLSTRRTGSGELTAYDASTANATVFPARTTKVRVYCTTDAYVLIGASPTATVAGFYMPAGAVEYFDCLPGDTVAAVKVSSAGNMHCVPCE